LADVRVVAVDQSITQGGAASGDNTTGRLARTVSLEVAPQQAERVAVAERLGTITLAIRAAEGTVEAADHRALTYSGDVSHALTDAVPSAPSSPRMRVIEGKDAREVTF
jgi:pilus assembly protein CpaB